MRTAHCYIIALIAIGLFTSLSLARPIRDEYMDDLLGVNESGNRDINLLSIGTVKTIGFPNSGIIIARVRGTVKNNSNRRQVFRNIEYLIRAPRIAEQVSAQTVSLREYLLPLTRNRYVVPKGKRRRMNDSNARLIGAFVPGVLEEEKF